jgi:hypothetical protein
VIVIVRSTTGMNHVRIMPFRFRQCKVTRYLPQDIIVVSKFETCTSLMQAVSSETKPRPQDKLKSFVDVCVLADLRSTLQVIIGVSSDRTAGSTSSDTSVLMMQSRFIERSNSFFTAQHSLVDKHLLVTEASRSHSDTPHSVGLLWTSDQYVAKTTT